jgi:hypothetical protein
MGLAHFDRAQTCTHENREFPKSQRAPSYRSSRTQVASIDEMKACTSLLPGPGRISADNELVVLANNHYKAVCNMSPRGVHAITCIFSTQCTVHASHSRSYLRSVLNLPGVSSPFKCRYTRKGFDDMHWSTIVLWFHGPYCISVAEASVGAAEAFPQVETN